MAQFDLKGLPQRPAWLQEFQAFIMRGNVIDLAVGIIIGAAFTTIVEQPGQGHSQPDSRPDRRRHRLQQHLHHPEGPACRNAGRGAEGRRRYDQFGLFINAVINFLIVSFRDLLAREGHLKALPQAGRRRSGAMPLRHRGSAHRNPGLRCSAHQEPSSGIGTELPQQLGPRAGVTGYWADAPKPTKPAAGTGAPEPPA